VINWLKTSGRYAMAECNTATKVGFFLAGVGIGVVVALLFAPKSGKETRKYIADKAEEGKDYVATKGRELRRHAEDLVEKSKDVVGKQKERLADALEAGKESVRAAITR
jgi:gas vesicle protein